MDNGPVGGWRARRMDGTEAGGNRNWKTRSQVIRVSHSNQLICLYTESYLTTPPLRSALVVLLEPCTATAPVIT